MRSVVRALGPVYLLVSALGGPWYHYIVYFRGMKILWEDWCIEPVGSLNNYMCHDGSFFHAIMVRMRGLDAVCGASSFFVEA